MPLHQCRRNRLSRCSGNPGLSHIAKLRLLSPLLIDLPSVVSVCTEALSHIAMFCLLASPLIDLPSLAGVCISMLTMARFSIEFPSHQRLRAFPSMNSILACFSIGKPEISIGESVSVANHYRQKRNCLRVCAASSQPVMAA